MWILVRKPLGKKTVAANVLEYGTGALNIDASRIGMREARELNRGSTTGKGMGFHGAEPQSVVDGGQGRFPANLVLSHDSECVYVQTRDVYACTPDCAVRELDRQSGISPAKPGRTGRKGGNQGALGAFGGSTADAIGHWPADNGGGASRFFYVPKASKSDKGVGNTHPTVKPIKLMAYLIRMITPPNGLVLDPFTGSGTTGVAAISEGFRFVGIEREREYARIAEKRIKAAAS